MSTGAGNDAPSPMIGPPSRGRRVFVVGLAASMLAVSDLALTISWRTPGNEWRRGCSAAVFVPWFIGWTEMPRWWMLSAVELFVFLGPPGLLLETLEFGS